MELGVVEVCTQLKSPDVEHPRQPSTENDHHVMEMHIQQEDLQQSMKNLLDDKHASQLYRCKTST